MQNVIVLHVGTKCPLGNPSEYRAPVRIILRYWNAAAVTTFGLTRYLAMQRITGPQNGEDGGCILAKCFLQVLESIEPVSGVHLGNFVMMNIERRVVWSIRCGVQDSTQGAGRIGRWANGLIYRNQSRC